ncbi:LuxR C-terminal-related transcriptional regulator [Kribbella pratensis]|uniref:LuxR C-terminal-related transcriptional regulator n=1 Tax=Kribbella pratensis TaxID=2512112 RepID=UPI001065E229|nr:LuxR C-terminal-related transcriptional regulator [Kribbella pratensis]
MLEYVASRASLDRSRFLTAVAKNRSAIPISTRLPTAAFPSLTDREVLELVAAGKGNATIAHELMISLKTVRDHVWNIFTKLQVPDRSTAIVKARQAGLGGN